MTHYEFDPQPVEIEWKEPTLPRPIGSTRSIYAEFWEALRENPGRWAIFRRGFKGSTGCYKKNHPGFEFLLRTEYTCGRCGSEMRAESPEAPLTCPKFCPDAYLKKSKVCWARFARIESDDDAGEKLEASNE